MSDNIGVDIAVGYAAGAAAAQEAIRKERYRNECKEFVANFEGSQPRSIEDRQGYARSVRELWPEQGEDEAGAIRFFLILGLLLFATFFTIGWGPEQEPARSAVLWLKVHAGIEGFDRHSVMAAVMFALLSCIVTAVAFVVVGGMFYGLLNGLKKSTAAVVLALTAAAAGSLYWFVLRKPPPDVVLDQPAEGIDFRHDVCMDPFGRRPSYLIPHGERCWP